MARPLQVLNYHPQILNPWHDSKKAKNPSVCQEPIYSCGKHRQNYWSIPIRRRWKAQYPSRLDWPMPGLWHWRYSNHRCAPKFQIPPQDPNSLFHRAESVRLHRMHANRIQYSYPEGPWPENCCMKIHLLLPQTDGQWPGSHAGFRYQRILRDLHLLCRQRRPSQQPEP